MNKLFSKNMIIGIFEVYDDKPSFDCIEVHQTHSNIVLKSSGENLAGFDADGIVISYEDLGSNALAIKTADCLPVLFIGDKSCALVHAGWRGLHNFILSSKEIIDIKPSQIYIGPSIYKYEVSEDFREHFPSSGSFQIINDKTYFDLQKEALSQLEQSYPNANISESHICTLKNNQYNSYRKDQTTKRNWNIFRQTNKE